MPSELHHCKPLLTALLCLVLPVLMWAELPVVQNHKLTGIVIGTELAYDYDSQSASYEVTP